MGVSTHLLALRSRTAGREDRLAQAYRRTTERLPEHEPHESAKSIAARAAAIRDRLAQVEFTAEERRQLAKSGQAMPNGSYPIRNRSDLKKAVRAYGRASNKAAVKAWIVKRAKDLGAVDTLPADWSVTQGAIAERRAKIRARRVKQDDGLGDAPSDAPTRVGVKNPDTAPPESSGRLRKFKKRKITAQAEWIVQQDDEKRVVHAVLQPPNELTYPGNFEGEIALIYPPEVLQEACWAFMEEMRNNAVGALHLEIDRENNRIIEPTGEYGCVVENYVAPCDFTVGDRTITQGSWVQAYRIYDDELWRAIKDGIINAPSLTSIEYELEEIDEE